MRFGVQLAPDVSRVHEFLTLATLLDTEGGVDLLGVQDHPYAPTQADTFTLMTSVLARTERIHVFPDVACLPLRGPAMLAKISASLDLVSGGRFDLGLGAGGFWPAIAAMGGPSRTSGEALSALEDAIEIIRAMWQANDDRVRVEGEHYSVKGVRSGPKSTRPIGLWLGSVGPRAHAVTGRLGDGWAAPIPHYLPYEKWAQSQKIITTAAVDAGRDPSQVARLAQLVGDITDSPAPRMRLEGETPIRTSAEDWVRIIADLASSTGFDTFIYWPENPSDDQIRRWARDVVPAARALL